MKRYEFTIGLYVDADNEQAALDKLSPVLCMLEAIDPDGDVPIECHGEVTP